MKLDNVIDVTLLSFVRAILWLLLFSPFNTGLGNSISDDAIVSPLYAVGHLGLGYLATKSLHRRPDLNIGLILTLSILPDIDMLVPFLPHRGPTHSIVVFTVAFIAVLLYKRGRYAPYMASYASHLVADVLTGSYFGYAGTQLLWPISQTWLRLHSSIVMGSTLEASLETVLMISTVIMLLYTKDYRNLMNSNTGNLFLFIPCGAVLGSLFFGYLFKKNILPDQLFIPHLFLSVALVALIGNNLFRLSGARKSWQTH